MRKNTSLSSATTQIKRWRAAKLTEDEITGMIGDNWIEEARKVISKDGTLSEAELEALSLGIEERES